MQGPGNLSLKIKTLCGTPQNPIKFRNAPAGIRNFGWRAAAAQAPRLAARPAVEWRAYFEWRAVQGATALAAARPAALFE